MPGGPDHLIQLRLGDALGVHRQIEGDLAGAGAAKLAEPLEFDLAEHSDNDLRAGQIDMGEPVTLADGWVGWVPAGWMDTGELTGSLVRRQS